MIIILLGYMGCGKTYIGFLLSKYIKYIHIDLDKYIEDIIKNKINNFFYKHGKYNFRIIEKNILNFIIKNNKNKNFIFSLGGGIPCYFNNLKIINNYGITFYIKVNNNILYKRLLLDNINRPILNKYRNKKLYLFIKNDNIFREKYYNKAKNIINSNKISFLRIAKNIKNKYFKLY